MARLIVRADANAELGLGHLTRMVALCKECMHHGWDHLICGSFPPKIREQLSTNGFNFLSLNEAQKGMKVEDALLQVVFGYSGQQWLALDGYHFDMAYQAEIIETGVKLLVMDDMGHLPQYAAHILVNQNAGAESFSYSFQNTALKLLGTEFVLLRNEFSLWTDWKRNHSKIARKIMVTFGGGDHLALLTLLLKSLALCIDLHFEIRILIGAVSDDDEQLTQLTNEIRNHDISLIKATDHMAELMEWSDMAIIAGGTTMWEAAFMQTPALIACLADNQLNGARSLCEAGGAILLSEPTDTWNTSRLARQIQAIASNLELRISLGANGRYFVDGFGARRVRLAMESYQK
jgi:UDP-2,4-diacetamido-2,4,6-trideoxy-beta-L-altropyranose hydrolase